MIDAPPDPHGFQRRGVLFVHQCEEEMLQRRVFVPPLTGQSQRAVESLFEAT